LKPPSPIDGRGEEDDPEILALLDFEPVPRKISQVGGWTPELQRSLIARLAVHGSIGRACAELGKDRSGATKLYNSPEGGSFRESWHAAIELAERRRAERIPAGLGVPPGGKPPVLDGRRKWRAPAGPLPGQVLNELGGWEDEESMLRRADDARDSIGRKLLGCRRLYLQEISSSPGKRAAFEILTELPIDWEKAKRLEPQDDEPYKRVNAREPDMILTAESGWAFGEAGYGPDKKAELRQAIDVHRAKEGLPPVSWGEE